jgi:hypothetical protein
MKLLFRENRKPRTKSNLEFTREPRIINIVPIELQVGSKIRIFQITVEIEYHKSLGSKPIVEYIVFEYCADIYNPTWRICGRVFPSDQYFIN